MLTPFYSFSKAQSYLEETKELLRTLSRGVEIYKYFELRSKVSCLLDHIRAEVLTSMEVFKKKPEGTYVGDATWFENDFYPRIRLAIQFVCQLALVNFYDEDFEDSKYRQEAWDIFHKLKPVEELLKRAIIVLA